jgi:hypothetical protein
MLITQAIVAIAMIVGLHYIASYMAQRGMTYGVWIAVLVVSTFIIVFGLDIWVTGDIGP